MAVSKAVQSAAKRKASKKKYKGKYPGPDEFKGDKKKIAAWQKKKKTDALKKRTAAATRQAADKAGLNKYGPTTPARPVASPTGSIIDPKQWEADMARLNIAEEDRDAWMALNQQWNDSILQQQQEAADINNKAASDITGFGQQRRGNFIDFQDARKSVNNALSYRGMGRSSAANRRLGTVAGTYSTNENNLANQIIQTGNNAKTAITRSTNTGNTTRAGIAARRQALANRGAVSGNYTR